MLKNLRIQNYALIRQLEIEFDSGFSIITGETGAGKSILLGALSLLLGQRADTGILFDQSVKCIVEAAFTTGDYGLEDFFGENDIDYEDPVIIRREIAPSGKSRAFINDSPVNLNTLRDLGLMLVDIHSQHQNLNLGNNRFQLMVVDTVARHVEDLDAYRALFREYTSLNSRISAMEARAAKSRADLEYLQFQYDQLEAARLKEGEQEQLEQESAILNHAEEIKRKLFFVLDTLGEDESGLLVRLRECAGSLEEIAEFLPDAGTLYERINSAYIELKDLSGEISRRADDVELDPERLEKVSRRLDLINELLLKHAARDVGDLIRLREEYSERIGEIASYDGTLADLKKKLETNLGELKNLSEKISDARKKVLPLLEKTVSEMLHSLGIPHARFEVKYIALPDYTADGRDKVEFLFSANKQAGIREIARVASGGELSRLMLAIKSLLSDTLALPTIIFDEVDSGVSGEIAEKVANIMKVMADGKQVINITHLPQVAGKGDYHYLVYKYEKDGATVTDIKLLDPEERVLELAKMLSGEELTQAAISNARELLN